MLGYIALRAATGAVGATSKNATPPNEVKPTEAGPFAVGAVVVLLAVIIVASMLNGGQVVAWITPLAILMGLIVLGGMFATAFSGARSDHKRLDSIPDLPTQAQEQERTRQLRERAAELNAHYATLRAPTAVLDAPAPAPGRLATMNDLLTAEQENARLLRVAAIMTAQCPTCTASGADFCTFQPGQPVTVLDSDRGVIVHDSRIGHAIKTKRANVGDVTAQFDGDVPDTVWKYAL